MREVSKKTVTNTRERTITTAKCDLCGYKSGKVDTASGEIIWQYDGPHHEISTTIVMSDRTSDRDGGGCVTLISYDICPKCFVNKIAQVLEACGLKPHKYERDW